MYVLLSARSHLSCACCPCIDSSWLCSDHPTKKSIKFLLETAECGLKETLFLFLLVFPMSYFYTYLGAGSYMRAIQAGATSITEPEDQPYGDRMAGVKDAFGDVWYIATHIKDVPL